MPRSRLGAIGTRGDWTPARATRNRHRSSAESPMIIKNVTDVFFFFSSRRRHTRFDCDWSSDVCSSDLGFEEHLEQTKHHVERLEEIIHTLDANPKGKKCRAMAGLIEEGKDLMEEDAERSEERRVGKEGRSRWSPYH